MNDRPDTNTPDETDWMAGLGTDDDGARPPFWEPLRRWRGPIVGVTLLAILQVSWVRLGGPWPALAIVGALLLLILTGPAFVRGVRDRRAQIVAIVAGLGIGVLAWPWMGPAAAVGAAALGWVAFRFRVWRFKIRHLMVLLALFAVMLRLGQLLGDSALALALLLGPPMVVAMGYLFWSRRPAIERDGLVDVLAIAARSRLPLGPSVGAFAALCSTSAASRLNALARRLEDGVSLSSALKLSPDLLPAECLTLARLAVPGESLPLVLDQAEAVAESRRRDPITTVGTLGYPFAVLLSSLIALAFLDFYIAPKIAWILADFEMPTVGLSVGSTLRGFAERFGIELYTLSLFDFIPVAFAVLAVLAIIAGIFRYQGFRVPLPWLWLREQRELAAVQRGIAIGLDTDQPLPTILTALRSASPTPWIRRALSIANQKIESGRPWTAALRSARLCSPAEAALMDAADRAGNPGWAIRELANARERRAAYRLRVLATMIRTLALAAVGLLVLAICVTYLRPLIVMIEELAENWE